MVTTVARCVASIETSAGRPLYAGPVRSSRWPAASPRLSNTALPDARCLQGRANFWVSRPSPSLEKSFVSRPASSKPSLQKCKSPTARPQSVTARHKVANRDWRRGVSKCVAPWGLDQPKQHKNNNVTTKTNERIVWQVICSSFLFFPGTIN